MSNWVKCDVIDCESIERVDGEAGCGAPMLPRGWGQLTVTVPYALPNVFVGGMLGIMRAGIEANPALAPVADYIEDIAEQTPPVVQYQAHHRVICAKHELPKFHRGGEVAKPAE